VHVICNITSKLYQSLLKRISERQIKEDEMGRACSTHGKGVKYIQNSA
jgi:hypothetical protein